MVDEYMAEVADTVGFKILIHSQSVMPFPEDDGISISPGTSTSIGISKVHSNVVFLYLTFGLVSGF